MRITIVIAGLGGGGAERVAVNLANAWAGSGHAATLLTISQKSRPSAYGIDARVARRDVGWPRGGRENELNGTSVAPILRGLYANKSTILMPDITMLALLRYAILTTEPDVVVSFITQTNVRVLAALHETKLPVIVCEVTDARRLHLRDWPRPRDKFYPRAAAVVACDPVIAGWFSTRGAKAISIHNPLLPPAPAMSRQPTSRHRVITMSRLSNEKRIEWLVRAFAIIAARFPDWDLEIYGHGPQRNFLEHLAESLAPPSRIRFCGFAGDAYGALAGAGVFVSASWIEGFGNSIWEALACGVPVIAFDAGPSISRLVRHEVDGLVVKENTVAALARALERLLSDDAERERFALRAPEVVERFSMQAALQQWDDLLTLSHTR